MTGTSFDARRSVAPTRGRRFVDLIADEVVVDIEVRPDVVHQVRVRSLDDESDAHPFGEAVWVVPVGQPDDWEDTDWLEDEAARMAQRFERVGGTTYRAVLRHLDWTLPAVAVTGVPAARVRHVAEHSTRLCWDLRLISVEESGASGDVRRGSFVVTTERRGQGETWTAHLTAEERVRARLAAIASRREGAAPGQWLAYRHEPGMPLELVGRLDLRGRSVPGPGYWRNGVPWLSSAGLVEFQAHSIEDIAWLVDLVATTPIALTNEEQQRLVEIRSRLESVGEPGWVSPSPTAFHVLHNTRLIEAHRVVPRPRHTPTEQVQAAFLEQAPADVTWLLERVESALVPGDAGRRVTVERPEIPAGSVDLAFPVDRSLGDLEIGRAWRRPDSICTAQGHVVIAADQWVRFTAGPNFSSGDLAHFVGLPTGTVRGIILRDAPIRAADIADAARIRGLRALGLGNTDTTDDDLAVLTSLDDLRYLAVDRTEISDAGLRHVARLERLETLNLSRTDVTDAGLAHLAPLQRLEHLYLFDCAGLTDEGLIHLLGLTRLRTINLDATEVTEQGLEPLWSLPNLERVVAYPGAFVCRG